MDKIFLVKYFDKNSDMKGFIEIKEENSSSAIKKIESLLASNYPEANFDVKATLSKKGVK